MNQKEFIEYSNLHLPPNLRKLTSEDLKKWEDVNVLRPHPGSGYCMDDIHTVIGLQQVEEQAQKQALKQGIESQKPTVPYPTSGTIYQVLSFLGEVTTEAEMKEIAIIRRALVKTGLISTLGFVYINFSPITGNTLATILAIPAYKLLFEQATVSKTLLVMQDAIQFEESETKKVMFTTLTPVLFIPGVKPTVVYSTFIFGGCGRFVGPQEYMPLSRPLYEQFLDVEVKSLDDILDFMATHFMIGSLAERHNEDEIDFVRTTQEKMRRVLMRATNGGLGVADLSSLSPFCEHGVIEGNVLGEMGGVDIFTAKGEPVSVGEIKAQPAYKWEGHDWVPYNQSKLYVNRYYNWLGFMWAELIDAIISGNQMSVCKRCGKSLPRAKTGRRKIYCGSENPKCSRARKAEFTRHSRERHT